ncbi:MAG: hypothetical protein WAU60_00765 [Candidatus Competibacter denitrificans]|jgi:hypothetical protein
MEKEPVRFNNTGGLSNNRTNLIIQIWIKQLMGICFPCGHIKESESGVSDSELTGRENGIAKILASSVV